MSFLLDILNSVNKFLGFLDISPKYLNRAYTILSLIPTLYILRIVFGLWQNHNYLQFVLYLLVFIGLAYFIVLNFFYYFFDKNLKADITQLFVKYLPDDAFNIQEEQIRNQVIDVNAKEVPVEFLDDYQLRLAENVQDLIQEEKIKTHPVKKDGYLLAKNTLYPFYFIKQLDPNHYSLQIGKNYSSLEEVGKITLPTQEGPLEPVGLFICGGDFKKNGVRYHEPYQLKLMAKKEKTPYTAAEEPTYSRRKRNKR